MSTQRRIAGTVAARAYGLALGIASLVVVARTLGPDGQGTLAAALGWASVFAVVAGLSLGQVSQRTVQLERGSEVDGTLFGALIGTLGILSLAGLTLGAVVWMSAERAVFGNLPPALLALAALLLPLMIWDEYASNLLAAAGRVTSYNRALVAGRTAAFLLLLALVSGLGTGVYGAMGAQIAGMVVTSTISVAVLWRIHRPVVAPTTPLRRALLRGALRLHPNTLFAFILTQSSVLILNAIAPSAEVGLYYVAWQMILVLTIVPQAAAQVLYGRLALAGPDGAWPVQKQVTAAVMLLVVALAAVAYWLGPSILVFLAGARFEPAGELFRLLLPALLGMSLAQLMAPQWISRGVFLGTSVVTGISAAVHVALTVVLAGRYGAAGAAWSTSLAMGLFPLAVQGCFAWWCEKQYRRGSTGILSHPAP